MESHDDLDVAVSGDEMESI